MKRSTIVLALTLAILGTWGCGPSSESGAAVDAKAKEVIEKMSARLTAAEKLTILAERSVDPEFLEGRNVIERANIRATIARPDRCQAIGTADGGGRNVYYDGKTFVIYDQAANVYGTKDLEGDLDALFAALEERFGIDPPLAQFLGSDPASALLAHVREGKYVGEENVGGAARHHLRFTEEFIDWELWVTVSDHLPHRLVIHGKAIEGKPEIRVEFREFDFKPGTGAESFVFTAPEGAVEVRMMRSEDLE